MNADHPLGVPPLAQLKLTIPESPAIMKPKPKVFDVPEEDHLFKAHPLKEVKPFFPVIEHKHSEPSDVQLPGDKIREKFRRKFEQEQEKEREEMERQRLFKANPLPSDTPDVAIY